MWYRTHSVLHVPTAAASGQQPPFGSLRRACNSTLASPLNLFPRLHEGVATAQHNPGVAYGKSMISLTLASGQRLASHWSDFSRVGHGPTCLDLT